MNHNAKRFLTPLLVLFFLGSLAGCYTVLKRQAIAEDVEDPGDEYYYVDPSPPIYIPPGWIIPLPPPPPIGPPPPVPPSPPDPPPPPPPPKADPPPDRPIDPKDPIKR